MTIEKWFLLIGGLLLAMGLTLNLSGWFGVREIGSQYYLMHAIQHGLSEPLALEFIQMTLIVFTLSILLHDISVKPKLAYFWRPGRVVSK